MTDFDGATIRRLRLLAGVTQEELARKIGVSFATVNRWENGHRRPSPAARRLLRAFFDKHVPEHAQRPDQTHPENSVRVLIVDDDPLVRGTLRRVLTSHSPHYEVETADDGYEAGVKTGTFRPHIVVLDLFLPRLDGIRVCRFLKESPETRDVKVVAVTGYGTEDTLRQIRKAGADAVLLKPLDMVEFLREIEALSPPGRHSRAVDESRKTAQPPATLQADRALVKA